VGVIIPYVTTWPVPGADLAPLRRDYGTSGRVLSESDLAPTWWEQLARWLDEAVADGSQDQPQAAVLATASAAGEPSARTVLLKSFDAHGLVFATNKRSTKGLQLSENPHAALCFSWIPLERQVIARGGVVEVSEAESDAIFRARPRGAQLAAWASRQSEVIASREELLAQRAEVEARFPDEVPRPAHWGGFRLVPITVELWQGQADRLHDRLRYRADGEGWLVERLQP
jgi:pyridoxamine 5'-phosphate oxidase